MNNVIQLRRATLVGCSGGCEQGKTACDCELCNSVAPREEFPAPMYSEPLRTEEDNALRGFVWRVYTAVVAMAVLAAILACWPKGN